MGPGDRKAAAKHPHTRAMNRRAEDLALGFYQKEGQIGEDYPEFIKIIQKGRFVEYKVLDGNVRVRDEPVVSIGANPAGREWITFEPNEAMKQKYEELKEKLGGQRVTTQEQINDLLTKIIIFARGRYGFNYQPGSDLERKIDAFAAKHPTHHEFKTETPIKVIPLEGFLQKDVGGVCRHHALFVSYLMNKLIQDEILPAGCAYHHRDQVDRGGHAWVIYQPNTSPPYYLIDSMWGRTFELPKHEAEVRYRYGNAAMNECIARYPAQVKQEAAVPVIQTSAASVLKSMPQKKDLDDKIRGLFPVDSVKAIFWDKIKSPPVAIIHLQNIALFDTACEIFPSSPVPNKINQRRARNYTFPLTVSAAISEQLTNEDKYRQLVQKANDILQQQIDFAAKHREQEIKLDDRIRNLFPTEGIVSAKVDRVSIPPSVVLQLKNSALYHTACEIFGKARPDLVERSPAGVYEFSYMIPDALLKQLTDEARYLQLTRKANDLYCSHEYARIENLIRGCRERYSDEVVLAAKNEIGRISKKASRKEEAYSASKKLDELREGWEINYWERAKLRGPGGRM